MEFTGEKNEAIVNLCQGLSEEQKEIFRKLSQRQVDEVCQIIKQACGYIFDATLPLVRFGSAFLSPSTRVDACFKVLKDLIEFFGTPVVLLLNEADHIKAFKAAVTNGFQENVKMILKSCLNVCGFDFKKSIIRNITCLCEEMNIQLTEASKLNVTTKIVFRKLVHNYHQIKSDYKMFGGSGQDKKEILRKEIHKIIKETNWKSTELNSLEEVFTRYYLNHLSKMLTNLAENPSKPISLPPEGGKMKVSARYRTHFILQERVVEDETFTSEYKEYNFPFSPDLDSTLKTTINAFLNKRGGRIYIGVDNSKIVVGTKLTYNQRDELKLHIFSLISSFYPCIKTKEYVKVIFLPIRDQDNKVKRGLFIVKIIVSQGDVSVLYSQETKIYKCHIRGDGQNNSLSAAAMEEEKEERKKPEVQAKSKVPDDHFIDPEPDPIEDNFEDKKEKKTPFYKKVLAAEKVSVKINHFPDTISWEMCGTILKKQNFPALTNYVVKEGHAFVNFTTLEGAKEFITRASKLSLFGNGTTFILKE